ncbi:ATP-binding protein [Campylobacter sp. LR264d]|uniref:ATP-binding protein n=1 Tax=Campylobacter sp. LR264d TaxID=2593544 RepID=UPI0012393462|nr:ATP-binding protein [Campylobacter sp. LR264d]KAA6231312.1 ATP-binding protein [Campylobacter sp. LR264d]
MKNLAFFYENPPKFDIFNERKQNLEFKNTLIKGPKNSGKKSLMLKFATTFKSEEVLFLDMLDLRFEKNSLFNLVKFLELNNKIKIVFLCNLNEEFDFSSLNLPLIISSTCNDLSLANFNELYLDFLDFEEFISINKNLPIANLLGLYLQSGRSNLSFSQELLRQSFSPLQLEILKYLAKNLGFKLSINKLFLELKRISKTSKDSVYKEVKELENNFIIKSIYNDDKRLKKLYFRDFGFKNALCIKKDFTHLFENLILNELFKLETEFFYNKFFSFYSKELKIAYISTPTLDIDLIKLRIKKILPKALELNIFHIIFITLSSEEIFYERGVKFEIAPFDKWALSF